MVGDHYLIDNKLNAKRLTGYLDRSGRWDDRFLNAAPWKGSVEGSAGQSPLALLPDGMLKPDVLYESSAGGNVRFYLPTYRLNVADGRYTSSLKWRGPEDDPNGPLAYLKLELIAVVPPTPRGVILQEIPHQAVARIGYQMAIQATGANQVSGPLPVLWIEVGALEQKADNLRQCRLAVASKPDFDRLYSVMTDPVFNARLEIRIFAVAGRRTWKQIVLQTPTLSVQKSALSDKRVLFTDMVSASLLSQQKPVQANQSSRILNLGTSAVKRFDPVKGLFTIPTTPIKNVISPQITPGKVISPAINIPPKDVIKPNLDVIRDAPIVSPKPGVLPSQSAIRLALSQTHAISISQALPKSDVNVKSVQGIKKAVPVRAILDEKGEPALLKIQVENLQEIRPFVFPPATNANVFDIPGDIRPGGHHILIPVPVSDGGKQIGMVYQDSAYQDLFYYRPQEFRLPRADTAPYLPEMRVAFDDVVTQSGSGASQEVELDYKVLLAYRVEPYIDPLLLSLAQQQMPGVRARFAALVPESCKLTLMLPQDETGGALAQTQRPGAEIHFDLGITDEVELTRTEFERIFSFMQSPSMTGVAGDVEASLIGNLTAKVPVRLSLKENAGEILSHTYKGPIGGGLHRVTVGNRIESPVKIERLYPVTLGAGIVAYPDTSPGQALAPGGEFDINYRLTPQNATVADISPGLSLSIQADPLKLWPQLFKNQGYTSDTFKLKVSIDASYFGPPPPGKQQLTGVRVDFDDGQQVDLTSANLDDEIYLRIPLLPRLLGDTQAKKYSYKVTNLIGAPPKPAESTAMIAGEGEGLLEIVPAG